MSVTDFGKETISKVDIVMLPKTSEQPTEATIGASETSNSSLNVSLSCSQGTKTKKREGKGCHLLPLVKHLMQNKENWKAVTTKENYHFLVTFTTPCQNFLWYTEDVTQLPHFTPDDPEILRNDVQFSKGSCIKQLVLIDIDGKSDEMFQFRKSQCLEQCHFTRPEFKRKLSSSELDIFY